MGKVADALEVGFLVVLGLASVIISLLGYLGFLPGPPGLVPTLTLGVVGITAGYLAIERRRKLDRIEDVVSALDKQLSSWTGEPVKRFPTLEALYAYIGQRLDQAEATVHMLSWGHTHAAYTENESQQEAFAKYFEHKQAAARRRNITFYEVNSYHETEGTRNSEEMLNSNPVGYGLRYYDFGGLEPPPLFQFVIIDSAEVIVAFYRGPFAAQRDEVRLVTRHPATVALFKDYFEVLWSGGRRIKDPGKAPDMQEIEKINRRLSNDSGAND